MATPPGAVAVVLGGSVAGLLSAAALAREASVARVVVVDRDADPAATDQGPLSGRKGTPQDAQLHGLLCKGRDNIEALVPGFTECLVANGGVACGRTLDFHWCHVGGPLPTFDDHTTQFFTTRPALDRALRAALKKAAYADKIEYRWGATVVGLNFTADTDAVTGVRLEDGPATATTTIDADLVVDALGSNSPVVKWVVKQGYEEPPTLEYTMDMGYSTMHFMLPLKSDPAYQNFKGKKGCLVVHRPEDGINRGSCLIHVGPNAVPGGAPDPTREYALGCNFGFGDEKPRCSNAEEWFAFAGNVASPVVKDFLQGSTPISAPLPFVRAKQVWRRFDRLKSWPSRLISVGDAVASLNPTYGQGMAMASVMATRVAEDAARLAKGDTLPTQKALAWSAWVPFLINTAEDTKMASTKGFSMPGMWIANRSTTAYSRAASFSPVVTEALLRVAHFQAPPTELIRPHILLRMVFFALLWSLLRAVQGGAKAKKAV